ncbi:HAD family hydrolase [Paenibacillus harenae]|uniref:HAD family hydrolase n=1 Tax=Paenibacillus harenae TaxID=306543 RepID=UPI0003FB6A09|nr:hypothetical protein [Paenibacillus harenae]
MSRPQLVLDIGGVLASNLSPLLWRLVAEEAVVSEKELYSAYKEQISERLWTGSISEEQFWIWVKSYTPHLPAERARSFIAQSLQPLPALAMLQEWSADADLHILSNHLPAWVEPVIKPYEKLLKSVTISSEAGFRKPHPDIFACVAPHLTSGGTVLFVDDQNKNLRQAALLGWRTLLADEEGLWISKVMDFLKKESNQE